MAKTESDTRTLGYLSRNLVGQRFEFRIRSIQLQQQDIKSVQAGISAIRRDNAPLTLVLPLLSESSASTKATTVSANPGAIVVNLNNTDLIEVGDFFNFAGHTKAYQVTGITGTQIEFTPNLVRPVSVNEQLTFNGCSFTCKIKGRPQKFSVAADSDAAVMELDLVEIR